MKAMFLSDLLITKKSLPSQMVLDVVVGLFMGVAMHNLYCVAPAVTVMISFTILFNLLAIDERAGWEQFRMALPLSRTDIMCGRYAILGLVALIGAALGALTAGLLIAAALALPNVELLSELMINFSWQALLLANVAGLVFALLTSTALLPLAARFGLTKAVRFAPSIIFIGIFFAFASGGPDVPHMLADFAAWVITPEGTVITSITAIVICLVLYALSCALSCKLYRSREM